jgi:hypothetical protein
MKTKENRGAMIGGLMMLIAGTVALIGQFVDIDGGLWGSFIVLGLGIAFVLAGIISHEFGFFVPGGILTGIGTGIALIAGPWQDRVTVDDSGVFMLAFAGGWFLITILGLIFTRQFHWWPLIPGGIIGLFGLALAYGGFLWNVVEWLGYLWPLALIAGGIAIIYQVYARRNRPQADDSPVEKHA